MFLLLLLLLRGWEKGGDEDGGPHLLCVVKVKENGKRRVNETRYSWASKQPSIWLAAPALIARRLVKGTPDSSSLSETGDSFTPTAKLLFLFMPVHLHVGKPHEATDTSSPKFRQAGGVQSPRSSRAHLT